MCTSVNDLQGFARSSSLLGPLPYLLGLVVPHPVSPGLDELIQHRNYAIAGGWLCGLGHTGDRREDHSSILQPFYASYINSFCHHENELQLQRQEFILFAGGKYSGWVGRGGGRCIILALIPKRPELKPNKQQ